MIKTVFLLITYNTICAKDLMFANCDVAKYSMTIKDEKLNKIRRPADQIKLSGQRRLSEERIPYLFLSARARAPANLTQHETVSAVGKCFHQNLPPPPQLTIQILTECRSSCFMDTGV